MYEAVIPQNSVNPSELMTLKPVKDNSKNEKAVEANDINTASFDFLPPPILKME